MNSIEQLLQVSAKLYKHLSTIPTGNMRDAFIEEIDRLLDERGLIIEELQKEGFVVNPQNKMHQTLVELDQGIRDRLTLVMDAVKTDLKNMQNSKKNEKQYLNPYSSVRVMDGRYYDKKK